MLVIDASVWVNGALADESGHEASCRLLAMLSERPWTVRVPSLAMVEVAAAVARTRGDVVRAMDLALHLARLPTVTIVELDRPLAERAAQLAAERRLRGADAVYATVAAVYGSTLITLDQEQLQRARPIVPAHTPAEFLDQLAARPA